MPMRHQIGFLQGMLQEWRPIVQRASLVNILSNSQVLSVCSYLVLCSLSLELRGGSPAGVGLLTLQAQSRKWVYLLILLCCGEMPDKAA
uniref:Uncharacterized protein n=1 Tax=Mus musculus TaxID=10090 RepID=Q3U092_MOUSE|nr:unnamed protein product [Mus musculus]